MSQRKNGRGESMLGSPRLFDAGPEVCCSSPWRQLRLQAVDCPRTAGTQPPGAGLAQPTPGLYSKEALIKSARAGSERFCSQARFGKWRNTVCTRKGHAASVSQLRWQRLRYISHFSNRRLGAKDPLPSRRRFIQSFPKEREIIRDFSASA